MDRPISAEVATIMQSEVDYGYQNFINGVASVIFLFSGQVNWTVALVMAISSTIGGFIGMAVARRVPQTYLRAFILLIGAFLTAAYFVKNYSLIHR